MTLFGDWHRGPQMIRKAIDLNPYYNPTVHHVLWLDWVRQGQYDRAYEETMRFATPMLFWDPLLKAVILGLLGRNKESVQAGKDLLACKPDFVERGRTLIRHFVKFTDLEDKIIEGLGCAGIDISRRR
jgi:adenylate cyclase